MNRIILIALVAIAFGAAPLNAQDMDALYILVNAKEIKASNEIADKSGLCLRDSHFAPEYYKDTAQIFEFYVDGDKKRAAAFIHCKRVNHNPSRFEPSDQCEAYNVDNAFLKKVDAYYWDDLKALSRYEIKDFLFEEICWKNKQYKGKDRRIYIVDLSSKTDNDKIKMYEVAFRVRVEKPYHMEQIDPNWPNHMEQIKVQLKEKQQQRLQKL